MSGIVFELRLDGAPASEPVAERMLDRLAHRGADGRRLVVEGRIALGCQHFLTTPEEVGERQPLVSGKLMVAFDGRLDNRDELLPALGVELSSPSPVSDAALVLAAYQVWGVGCFEHLLGPFAVVVWDAADATAHIARDGLGDRTLVYSLDRHRFLVASEEHALLAHPEISNLLDERRVAHHFAVRVPADGSTFFTDITELQPGEVISVSGTRHRRGCCWQPQGDASIARLSDADCADRYRALLTDAVRCRLRSASPPAVLMSGGLDSTSIAAIGARQLAAASADRRMRAVSWVFNELRVCDERVFIDAVTAECGLDALQVVGDNDWPLRHPEMMGCNPSTPEQNPYRELKQRAYRRAVAAGSRVVFSGASADSFSAGCEGWLWELVTAGRVLEATRSMVADLARRGVGDALRRAGFGRPLRPLRRRLAARTPPLPWLTERARRLVEVGDDEPWWSEVFPRPAQCAVALGSMEARSVSLEIFHANHAGVDLRHPYRDRRLTELMLQVAAHQLYRRGRHKHLARVAAADLLPHQIPARAEPTLLTPLFRRGVFDRERSAVERLLRSASAEWSRYVDRGWVEEILRSGPRRPLDEVLLWQCVGFESWRERHLPGARSRQDPRKLVSLQESAA